MSSTHMFARPYHSKKCTTLHISKLTSEFKQLGAFQVPKSTQSFHFKITFLDLSGGNKRAANPEDS